ncbi:MAG: dipeptide/oligopeptide/nickel ABC transporter ATP-binding protein [Planctomycetaceae bacterium]|nr:dipeptide/oligopeptide/nickel ABC transporter ATP-binding protein [Planctomycetaceae bacterium]
MSIVSVSNVSKVYRQAGLWHRGRTVRAVDGVSLDIAEGQCLALVGASGSGKSTLGRIVLGLERPDGGSVSYRGRDLWSLSGDEAARARRDVQVVFQNSHGAVNPRFSACDIVGEPLMNFDSLRGRALRDRVADLLAQVGVDPSEMDKLPHQFSGGELQRICLARALAPKPGLIVLDEAVSSLDMLNQARILRLLETVKRETGTAYLFISHDLRVVCRLADSLAVMEAGTLAARLDDIASLQPNDAASIPALRKLADALLPAEPEACRDASYQDSPLRLIFQI